MKKVLFCFFFPFLFLLFSGCQSASVLGDYREITSTAFIAGAAVDITEDGQYELTMEIIDFSAGDLESGLKTKLLVSHGKTVSLAAQAASAQLGNTSFWSHAETFLLSREAALKGCGSLVDFLLYNVDTGLTTTFAVADTARASDILKLSSHDTGVISYDIQKILSNNEGYAAAIPPHLFSILEELRNPDAYALIGIIGSVGESEDEQYPILSGGVLLSDSFLTHELSTEQMTAYAILHEQTPNVRFTCVLSDGTPYTLEILQSRISVSEDNTALAVNVCARLASADARCEIGTDSAENLHAELENVAAETLSATLNDLIDWAQTISEKDTAWWLPDSLQNASCATVSVNCQVVSSTNGPGAPFSGGNFWDILFG